MNERVSTWRPHAYSVATMRAQARRVLPRPIFDFADGGAEDERTLRRNEAAFSAFGFLPRPLCGSSHRDLSIELFGKSLRLPVLIGPTGLAGLFWPDGECATARAAARAGTVYCASHASVVPLEAIAACEASPRWMQVFVYRDRGFTREFAERAAAAKYDALVLTIDNQLTGNRERDLRNGFTIPPRFGPAAFAAMALKLPWLMRMRGELKHITFGNYVDRLGASDLKTLAERMPSLLDTSLSWRDVDQLRSWWKGPFLLKGILHPQDAKEALARGVDGVIVSNHGGRQLDGAVAAVEALPAVVEAVAGRIPILVDGGIRRGRDVIVALALGASACVIGRPHLWGLAVAGEAGVMQVLEILRREIDRVMGLCGVSSIGQIGPDLLMREDCLPLHPTC
ncbi:MAG: alpha-hydroxy-acid oxidizing protein [Hyphomicrobiales bacterium]|nr:alpha-hydroxy-acid oxidizing protein [Hyphomicrobiales bacterium]